MKLKTLRIKDELYLSEKGYAKSLVIEQGSYDTLYIGVEDNIDKSFHEGIVITKNCNIDKIIKVLKSYKKQNKRWK
jgi:hypothetical protein